MAARQCRGRTDILVDANGQNLVYSEAVDAAGNVEKFHSSTMVFLDLVAPYTAAYGAVAHDNPAGRACPRTAMLPFPNPGTWFEYLTPGLGECRTRPPPAALRRPSPQISFSDQRRGIAGWEKHRHLPRRVGGAGDDGRRLALAAIDDSKACAIGGA